MHLYASMRGVTRDRDNKVHTHTHIYTSTSPLPENRKRCGNCSAMHSGKSGDYVAARSLRSLRSSETNANLTNVIYKGLYGNFTGLL